MGLINYNKLTLAERKKEIEKGKFKKVICCQELLVVNSNEIKHGKKTVKGTLKMVLRVVSWSAKKPVLEKRVMSLDIEDGLYYPYKKASFNSEDVELICENKQKIIETIENFDPSTYVHDSD